LNIELTGFTKLLVLQLRIKDFLSIQNAFGSYTAKVEFLANKTAKRFSTWLVILIALTTMSLIPLLLYLPNNVDIHSASLGFNYDILDNLKISVGEFGAMANRIPAQLRVMKQSSNNTMVNYGA
jgi:hypothetical protein